MGGIVGILTWISLHLAGVAVRESVSFPPGSKSAAKTTMAETVKVRKEERKAGWSDAPVVPQRVWRKSFAPSRLHCSF